MSDTSAQPQMSPSPTPEPPATPGVLGDGGLHAGKYNMRLVRRAIRNDWPIPEDVRQCLIAQMGLIMAEPRKPKSAADGESAATVSDRDRIAAAKVLLTADSINARREGIDVAAARAEMGPGIPTTPAGVTVAPGDNSPTQINMVNFYLPHNGRD